MDKRDFTRFGFNMSFGQIPYIAQAPCTSNILDATNCDQCFFRQRGFSTAQNYTRKFLIVSKIGSSWVAVKYQLFPDFESLQLNMASKATEPIHVWNTTGLGIRKKRIRLGVNTLFEVLKQFSFSFVIFHLITTISVWTYTHTMFIELCDGVNTLEPHLRNE